ncbi:MAG TPA: hypothetical protein VMW93_02195 [bacterium]|nr:hypothetical protein [bacterium]
MQKKLVWFGALLAACAVAASASMVALTTEDLVDHASLVVVGTVEEVTSYPPDARGVIYSDAKVRVGDTVVGATGEDYVTVRYMGGEYDGLAFGVTAEPTFRVGEEVVLFLAPAGDGVYKCPDGVQSKLSVVDGTVLPVGETLTAYLAKVAAAAGR